MMWKILLAVMLVLVPSVAFGESFKVERVSTAVPFPRGLVLLDGKLYTLARGRVRSNGGVSAEVEDRAGSLWVVDPSVAGPADGEPTEAVKANGAVMAEPTSPPFRLWDRGSVPVESDHQTDRPYCCMRYDPASKSFFIDAFSGIDLKAQPGKPAFVKNFTDAVLRYDTRSGQWSEVERHDPAAGPQYPSNDPKSDPAPHGWLKGPDNLLVVGRWLYVGGKDNSRVVRYDLSGYAADPHAPPPGGVVAFDSTIDTAGAGPKEYLGPSAFAVDGGYFYAAYRTTGEVIRMPLNDDGTLKKPLVAELIARFTPFDPATKATADITDITFDAKGRLYVINADPCVVHRFTPDPATVYDGRDGGETPWLDLAGLLGKRTKGENILIEPNGSVLLTTANGYPYQKGADGTIYRVTPLP